MGLDALQELLDTSLQGASPLTRELFSETSMAADELQEFVNDVISAGVATVGKSGRPHAALTLIACADDGTLYIAVNPRSRLSTNLRRSSDVAITIDGAEHGVMGQGKARYVGTAPELRSTLLPELDRATKRGRWVPADWDGAVYRLNLARLFAQ